MNLNHETESCCDQVNPETDRQQESTLHLSLTALFAHLFDRLTLCQLYSGLFLLDAHDSAACPVSMPFQRLLQCSTYIDMSSNIDVNLAPDITSPSL